MQTIQLGRRYRNKQRLIAGGAAAVLGALLGAGAVAAVFFAMATTAARPGGSGAPADTGIVQLERVVIVGPRADRQQQAAAIEQQLPRVLVTGRSSAAAATAAAAPAELHLAADGFKPRAL